MEHQPPFSGPALSSRRALPFQPCKLSLGTEARWRLFRTIEVLSGLRQRQTSRPSSQLTGPIQASLWVYASTIGELNAIEPLLRAIHQRLQHLALTLITDRPQYAQAYARAYPAALVYVTEGDGSEAQALARVRPPAMLLLAEIPCMPFDAPCRFSFGFVVQAKRRQAPIALLNGWLYGGRPASRIDQLEAALFTRAYLSALDFIGAQTQEVAATLLARGASLAAVTVTGNIKFDSIAEQQSGHPLARRLLHISRRTGRRIIVAGSVNDRRELTTVINAFARCRSQGLKALLVVAPRHPEVQNVRSMVQEMLVALGLRFRWYSEAQNLPPDESKDCLVLDTFGDLRAGYAVCDLAHVGINHNVLEPFQHGKFVTVLPGWQPAYPSFAVYRELLERRAVAECPDTQTLSATWARHLADPAAADKATHAALAGLRGATARSLEALEPLLLAAERRHRGNPNADAACEQP